MKKYTRLCIAVIAFLSLLTMLVYRYRYHNLLTIVELRSYFTNNHKNLPKCLSRHSSDNLTLEIISSSNHWAEIFAGIYFYSPHMISNHVILLGYSRGVSTTELMSITCDLWFESNGKNLKSNLNIHLLEHETSSFLFYVECSYVSDLVKPDAITFIKNNISRSMPIYHTHFYNGQFAACVSPLPAIFSDGNKIVEFLIYHSNLGIKHFVLYYTALSAKVRELLFTLSKKCDIVIEFQPWNVPSSFEKMKLKPYLIDCIFHVLSLNHSDYVFSLNLDNFITLQKAPSLKDLIYSNLPFDFLQLQQKLFCLEYPNYTIAEELDIKFRTLLKTKMSANEGKQIDVIYDLKQFLQNILQIPGGFKRWFLNEVAQSFKTIKSTTATIFSYTDCNTKTDIFKNSSYIENKQMWLYKQMFFDSCSYKHSKSIIEN